MKMCVLQLDLHKSVRRNYKDQRQRGNNGNYNNEKVERVNESLERCKKND